MKPDGLPRCPRNIRLTLEYDGTDYVGWEKQKNGLGIQQVVEEAVERITGERPVLNGSGRTDAGVHALGQVASFTLQNRIAASDLQRALNAVLPDDVAVTSAEDVSLFFHARFSATSKTYRYRLLTGRTPSPLNRREVHHHRAPLDVAAMQAAAPLFLGRHDFSAFCREADRIGDCRRTLHRLDIETDGPFVTFWVAGDGFLYNMVRIIVGTLIHVGSGKLGIDDVAALLRGGARKSAGPTVPAHGLALVEVCYPG